MKYLVQNKKEFSITIAALIVAILDFLKVLTGIDYVVNDEEILAVVSGLIGAVCWYYNMPTSRENCEETGRMRQRKAEKKAGYVGEVFHNAEDDL